MRRFDRRRTSTFHNFETLSQFETVFKIARVVYQNNVRLSRPKPSVSGRRKVADSAPMSIITLSTNNSVP